MCGRYKYKIVTNHSGIACDLLEKLYNELKDKRFSKRLCIPKIDS